MRYTATETEGERRVIEVRGCQTCPHVQKAFEDGKHFMRCLHGRKRKIVGNWEGAYHKSCALPTDPEAVSLVAKEAKA